METIKLKPCPFCGNEAKAYIHKDTSDAYTVIQCENCKASVNSRIKTPLAENRPIDLVTLMDSAASAAFRWNLRSEVDDLVRKRLDEYADRVERQISETECKRDVLGLCKDAEEKARVTGFVDGLNWLLEIIDDEYTRHDEDDD